MPPADRPRAAGGLARLRRVLALGQSPVVRVAFVVVALALAAWAVLARRDEVLAALGRLRPELLVAAALATVANGLLTGMAWRAVLIDLGSRLPWRPAARVFFVGQIGKYVPGSVWPILAQAELAREHGVPRRRTGAAMLVTMLLSAASGLLLVLVCLPWLSRDERGDLAWGAALALPVLALLHPRLLGPALDRLIRLLGGEPLEHPPSLAGTARATAWAVGAWLAAGLQVALLVAALGVPWSVHLIALACAGYAFAWAAGMLVVIAPAGAGAREVVLAAALAGVLDLGAAVVVVLVSRVLFAVVDIVSAVLAHGVHRTRPAVREP